MKKEVILVGGGKSVREGIEKGLWEKIKHKEVWSLNYAFMMMPYLPIRELFVDRSFYKNNIDALQAISEQGVRMDARFQSIYADIDVIHKYQTTKEKGGYKGKQALKVGGTPHIFVGEMGLVGTFALSLAIAEDYNVIYLLGYDFGVAKYEDKDTHFYQGKLDILSAGVGHPNIYLNRDSTPLAKMTDYKVYTQEKDVAFYNVSLNSRLPYFTKISYDKFFELIGTNNVSM